MIVKQLLISGNVAASNDRIYSKRMLACYIFSSHVDSNNTYSPTLNIQHCCILEIKS